MSPKEAYKILEVSDEISDDDLKSKYKELAKKYHPDIFKEDPDKFKRINEAYQLVSDYRQNPEKYEPRMPTGNGFWGNVVDLGDILFGGSDFFRNNQQDESFRAPAVPITVKMNISFHESVLGCTKELNYNRSIKCSMCHASGHHITGNGCDKCDGFGRVTNRNGGVIFQSQCQKCMGKGVKKNKCEKCGGKKVLDDQRTGNINIPAGSKNSDVLRLVGEGNFVGRAIFGDAHTDVHVNLNVEPYNNMYLNESDVCSDLNISLLEALEGTTKDVETVYGNRNITINPKSKHSDQIKIPKCGVKGTNGSHVVKLNVEYPDDISKLVGALKDGISNSV